jgi:regulator of RNase E activity RraB
MAIQDVLSHQLNMDQRVLSHLAERGDVPTLIHAIEHHFISDNHDALVALCQYARSLQFDPATIQEGKREAHDAAAYWYVDIISRIPLADGQILREAALMKFLAIAYRVEYDGWGTLVQNGAV